MTPAFLSESDPDQAWNQFVAEAMPTIDRACARAVPDPDLAADVAAEVLERLAKDWPRILERFTQSSGRANFFVWLAVVSRNLAIDILRSRVGRAHLGRKVEMLDPTQDLGAKGSALGAAPTGPTESLVHSEAHSALAEVLSEFSSEERFLIRAYYLEGGTAKEVAAATGLGSPSQVYETMKVILRKLRRAAEVRGLRPVDCVALHDFDWGSALPSEDQAPR